MDNKMIASVLVCAVLLVGAQAGELVLQLTGTIRMVPDDLLRIKVNQGIISPTPQINSRGMRYFIQIKPDTTSDVYVPGFGRQRIQPYSRRRIVRIIP